MNALLSRVQASSPSAGPSPPGVIRSYLTTMDPDNQSTEAVSHLAGNPEEESSSSPHQKPPQVLQLAKMIDWEVQLSVSS